MSNKSEVHDRVCKAEENIEKIFEEIEGLKAEDRKIRVHYDKELLDQKVRFNHYRDEQADINNDLSMRIDDNLKNIQ